MGTRLFLSAKDGAREKLIEGINFSADNVAHTMGNKGRNTAMDTQKFKLPLLTNDGISILRELKQLEDPFVELGVKLARQAASKTEDNAGDGTTTTTILLQAFVNEMAKSDVDILTLRPQIEQSVNKVVRYLTDHAEKAKSVDMLAKAATISCRDPEIGQLIAKAVAKAGDDGMIALEDNLGGDTHVEMVEGLQLRTGYIVPNFINTPALRQVIVKNAGVIVGNMSLQSVHDFNYVAEQTLAQGYQVLVIFAQEFGAEFMQWAYLNWLRQDSPLKILPVRFNTMADIADGILRDIAAVAGAKYIDTMVGDSLQLIDKAHENVAFGTLKKVVQTKTSTTILPSNKVYIEQRIKELKYQLNDLQDYQAENVKERIARLKSACFNIAVGGVTETELLERKTRMQDALNTARAAYKMGVVKGGGYALYDCIHLVDGIDEITEKVLLAPVEQLAFNNHRSVDGWTDHVARDDAVWDSAIAVTEALINSAAQAVQVMLVDNAIVDPEVNT